MSRPQPKPYILNEDSFGALHRSCRRRLLASVTEMVRNHDRAEEITAKAFYLGWSKREQFRGEAAPYTWLYAIACNLVRHRGARRDEISFDEFPDLLAEPRDFVENLGRQDAACRLRTALDQIPPVYRRVLIARFLEGDSTRTVAKREGIPLGTVLSRVSTGKKLLRAKLETKEGIAEGVAGLFGSHSSSASKTSGVASRLERTGLSSKRRA